MPHTERRRHRPNHVGVAVEVALKSCLLQVLSSWLYEIVLRLGVDMIFYDSLRLQIEREEEVFFAVFFCFKANFLLRFPKIVQNSWRTQFRIYMYIYNLDIYVHIL